VDYYRVRSRNSSSQQLFYLSSVDLAVKLLQALLQLLHLLLQAFLLLLFLDLAACCDAALPHLQLLQLQLLQLQLLVLQELALLLDEAQ
jgi:hypothetical protein